MSSPDSIIYPPYVISFLYILLFIAYFSPIIILHVISHYYVDYSIHINKLGVNDTFFIILLL